MPRLAPTALLSFALTACAPGETRESTAVQGAAPANLTATGARSTQGGDTPVSNADPAPRPLGAATPSAKCPVARSYGWSAAVIGQPPGSGDRLRVEGTLVMAREGYRAWLEQGPVLEIYPPIQQLELFFARAEKSESREIPVRGEFPALDAYDAIDVRCGGRSLASISSVAWTENKIMEKD